MIMCHHLLVYMKQRKVHSALNRKYIIINSNLPYPEFVKIGYGLFLHISVKFLKYIFLTDSIEKRSAKMIHAKQFCIEVIEPATFLDAIEKGGNAIELIVEKNIAPWARNVSFVNFVRFISLIILFLIRQSKE